MKKIYLFILMTAFIFTVTAQDAAKIVNTKGSGVRSTPSLLKTGNNFTPQAVIFSEDFGSGIPPGWTVTDSVGNGEIWTVAPGPKGNSIQANDTLKSLTASNGIAIVDDDFYGNNNSVTSTSLITPAIDATGLTVVKVSFYDYFRMYNVGIDQGVFYVSIDSINWTEIFHAETGLVQNAATPNPRFNEFDISTIAANQPTVYLKFTYRGDWGYWWQIDDITVFEPSLIDGGVSGIDPIPSGCNLSANTPITVSITNVGLNDISNFNVSYTINSGSPVTETYTGTITSGSSANYTFATTANFSAPGNYIITAYTTITSDVNTSNDSSSTTTMNSAPTSIVLGSPFTESFETGGGTATAPIYPAGWTAEDTDGDSHIWDMPDTYAHTGTRAARVGFGGSGPVAAVAQNWLFTPCLDLMSGTTYYLSFWYKRFDAVNTPYSIETRIGTSANSAAMTIPIAIEPDQQDTSYHFVQRSFTVPSNGIYYLGFNAFGNNPQTSIRVDDVMIDLVTGINEVDNSHLFTVYPNPSSGIVYIMNRLNYKQTKIEILNNLGQIIYSISADNLKSTQIDLSSFASGIYSMRFITENEMIVKKISLQ